MLPMPGGNPARAFPAALLALALAGGCRGASEEPGRTAPAAESTGAVRARAAALLRQGEPREAMEVLRGLPGERDADTDLLLGEAALRSGFYAQAEKAYRRVLRARPEDLHASTRLARIAFLEARYDDAARQLDWILARSPDHVEARSLRTRIRIRQGNLEGAAADARRWADLAPRDAEPLRCLGLVRRLGGDPAGAVEILRQAVALDPRHLPSRLELARAYADSGERRLAGESLREAARLEREQRLAARRRAEASYHRIRALQQMEAGDAVGALRNFRDALALDPDDPELLREAAEAALGAGEPGVARPWLDRALDLAPSSAAIRKTRGKAALAAGSPEAAIAEFLEAVRVDPTDPASHRGLERAYRALNRPEAEREAALAEELEASSALPRLPESLP
jgi:tetratricopeptide (TPR) repeat protein